MKKLTSDEPERCPDCGANLALVGRSHNCTPRVPDDRAKSLPPPPKKKPKPCPHGMHHPHACPDCINPDGEPVFDEDGRFTDPEADRLMQGALQSTRARKESQYPSHPDCERCNRNREMARQRAQYMRERRRGK